jgi:hypothetical protein
VDERVSPIPDAGLDGEVEVAGFVVRRLTWLAAWVA